MKVLVLDGHTNQAVACVRSLARAGHRVTVGSSSSWCKAGWSRFCRGTLTYPSPERDAEAFVGRIAAKLRRDPGSLILPMTERTALLLSASRDLLFAAGGRMELPPHATLLHAFDKFLVTGLAKSLGIAVPRTMLIANEAEAAAHARSVPYPSVLKPRTSEAVSPDGLIHSTGRPMYAQNEREFLAAYREIGKRSSMVLAQEFIEGAGAGYFALMRRGELCAEFGHIRIRDTQPSGSGSSLRVSVKPESKVREAGLAILDALNWHGVAMVEFRIRPDGTPVLMELNGRFWNSLALAVHAGVDFPALLARLAEQGELGAPPAYRLGVRCRWLLGDFFHLINVWRGAPPGYPGKFPNRLRTVFNLLLPVPGTFHDNFTLEDPLPEVGDWLDCLFRRLPAAFRELTRSLRSASRTQSREATTVGGVWKGEPHSTVQPR